MKKQPRIAIISPVPFFYHVPIYQSLSRSGRFDLTVIYCSDDTLKNSDPSKEYGPKNAKFHKTNLLEGYRYKFFKNYSWLPAARSHWPFGFLNIGVWGEIRKGRYDAVILQAWNNATWFLAIAACLVSKTPFFFMSDANVATESKKSWYKKALKKGLLADLLFPLASGFLASGRQNSEYYRYFGVPESKIRRFPYWWGYDKVILQADILKNQRNILRRELGIGEVAVVFLYAGRLSKEKNLIALLEAFEKTQAPGDRKELLIVGGGPVGRQIKEEIKNRCLSNIRLLDFQTRETLFDLYAAADVLLLPSSFEPWGMVVAEAACFALPIIASSNVGAVADLVFEGMNGYIFASGNINDLSLCIDRLAKTDIQERKKFGNASRDIIAKWLADMDPVVCLEAALSSIL